MLLSFIKADDGNEVSSVSQRLHICYATTQVYLGHLQRDLLINNEWIAPVSEQAGLILISHSQSGACALPESSFTKHWLAHIQYMQW